MTKTLIICAVLSACTTGLGGISDGAVIQESGMVMPGTGWGSTGTTWSVDPSGVVSWCCDTWFVPIPADAGDAIASVTVPLRDNGPANGIGDGNQVALTLAAHLSSGATIYLGNAATDGTGMQQTITLTFSPAHVISSGESLVLQTTALHGGALPGPATHASAIGVVQTMPGSPACEVSVSRLDIPTISVDVVSACSGDGWNLEYRLFSTLLATTNRRDRPCGSSTHVEFINMPGLADLRAFGWIYNRSQRVDCHVSMGAG